MTHVFYMIHRFGWIDDISSKKKSIYFVPLRYQLPEGKSAGLDLEYFYMIHRFGWIDDVAVL